MKITDIRQATSYDEKELTTQSEGMDRRAEAQHQRKLEQKIRRQVAKPTSDATDELPDNNI